MPPTSAQYRVVMAVPLIPVGLALIASFFLTDTPRWLASQDRAEEALAALTRLRSADPNDTDLAQEFGEIHQQIRSKEQALANTPILTIVKEIATITTYRKRFLLGALMQTVAQWSGKIASHRSRPCLQYGVG